MAFDSMGLNFSGPSQITGNMPKSGFSPQGAMAMGGGIASILSGLFNDSGAPYQAGMDELQKYLDQAKQTQSPFYDAGTSAIPDYQKYINGMSNPSDFINNLMGKYQESPYANYLQNQSRRGSINQASASGLIGSTPLAQQMQQNSANIGSGDMNNWLQSVLGINDRYGAGLNRLMTGGQNSANSLTNLLSQYGQSMAQGAYGREAGANADDANLYGGIGSLIAGLLI